VADAYVGRDVEVLRVPSSLGVARERSGALRMTARSVAVSILH
jgi:hypothetical protein